MTGDALNNGGNLCVAAAAAEMAFNKQRPPLSMQTCPMLIQEVMEAGWDRQPDRRPTFKQVLNMLEPDMDELKVRRIFFLFLNPNFSFNLASHFGGAI